MDWIISCLDIVWAFLVGIFFFTASHLPMSCPHLGPILQITHHVSHPILFTAISGVHHSFFSAKGSLSFCHSLEDPFHYHLMMKALYTHVTVLRFRNEVQDYQVLIKFYPITLFGMNLETRGNYHYLLNCEQKPGLPYHNHWSFVMYFCYWECYIWQLCIHTFARNHQLPYRLQLSRGKKVVNEVPLDLQRCSSQTRNIFQFHLLGILQYAARFSPLYIHNVEHLLDHSYSQIRNCVS